MTRLLTPDELHQYQSTPVGPDGHHDMPLSNIAVSAFSDGTDEFIAEQLFPMVPVSKQSNRYYIIDKQAFLSIPDAKRAPRAKAGRVEFKVSSNAYFADNYALAAENALEDLQNADDPIRLRENSVRLVTTNLRRDQENRIASLITSISNIGSGVQLTGTDKWGDSNSDPIAHVNTAAEFIRSRTGLVANTMVMDWNTLQIVRRHPLLLDMYKYTSGGQLSNDQLREIFQVGRLLIGKGVKENALEGGTSSMTNIWGNNVLLCHVGMATGMQSQTFGLRFRWRVGGMPDFQVKRATYNMAGQGNTEIVETGYFQDEKIVATDLAYCIQNTL